MACRLEAAMMWCENMARRPNTEGVVAEHNDVGGSGEAKARCSA